MSIVATQVEIHGTAERRICFYKCQDHLGNWHPYGPVHAAPDFDAEAHKAIVAAKVEAALAEREAAELLS